MGFFIFYFASFILGLFGVNVGVLDPTNSSALAIGINLVIIVIAALNLVLDFDFIEGAAKRGAPKVYGVVWSVWFACDAYLVVSRDFKIAC